MASENSNGNGLKIYPWVIGVMLTIIGFLGGVGTVHLTILNDINENSTKITVADTRIGALQQSQNRIDEQQGQMLSMMGKLVEQNTFLIQKIIANSGRP